MTFRLPPTARAAGYGLAVHDRIGSTNAEALRLARDGGGGPLWVVTDDQFAGHGRRGRLWHAPKGNLAASLLVAPPGAPALLATLGFAASIALSDALRAALPAHGLQMGVDGAGSDRGKGGRLELKWPNDVLVSGAKVAGILLEATPLSAGGHALVIGFGVNVIAHPGQPDYPTASLRELGYAGEAADVFEALADAWLDAYRLWAHGTGLEAIRRRWLERAAGLGGEVAVRTGEAVLRGTLETIDEDCRLVVRGRDGAVALVTAGDVHFGAVASLSSGPA